MNSLIVWWMRVMRRQSLKMIMKEGRRELQSLFEGQALVLWRMWKLLRWEREVVRPVWWRV